MVGSALPRPPGTLAGAAGGAPTAVGFVSVVLPCLDEEDAVADVVAEARRGLAAAGVPGEVIVVDNGSTDRSAERAIAAGARVVREAVPGYGAAVAAGIASADGDVVVMADADGSYDLGALGDLLAPLRHGADLVIASRLAGKIDPRAMPPLHRFLGTPLLSGLVGALAGTRFSDSQSGYRAFRRDAVGALELRSTGMEYASEMLLRGARAGLAVVEVPTRYRPRVGASKLRPAGDGWRHARLLLLFGPHLSLIMPGALAVALGVVLCAVSLAAPTGLAVGGLRWLPVFLGPMLLVLGAQATLVGCLAARRSAATPPWLADLLHRLDRPGAGGRLFGAFVALALAGLLLDGALLVLWLAGRSGPAMLGPAGLAQALIVIGGSGVATLVAADDARDLLRW